MTSVYCVKIKIICRFFVLYLYFSKYVEFLVLYLYFSVNKLNMYAQIIAKIFTNIYGNRETEMDTVISPEHIYLYI